MSRCLVPTVSLFVVVVVAAAAAGGCGDRQRHEARLLIERVSTIDPEASPAERRPRVEALKELTLHGTEVRRVRDLCVNAHEALLSAEDEQASARARLTAVAPQGYHGKLAPADAHAIADALSRSNDALARARRLLPKCQDEVAALSSRYGRRR